MNRATFEEFYPIIYNYIYYRVLHRETAEDLTSDVFYKALAFEATYDEKKASYKTWLLTIARNVVANHYRDKKDGFPLDDFESLAADGNFEDDYEKKEEFRRLHELLKTLPERKRVVIALRFWGDMTYKEIALRVGLHEKSVSSMMSRLMTKLNKLWH